MQSAIVRKTIEELHNPKQGRNGGIKRKKPQKTKNKRVNLNHIILVITLDVNGLTLQVKGRDSETGLKNK